jgi:hypothetical protein
MKSHDRQPRRNPVRSLAVFSLLAILASTDASADAPTCDTYNGQGYCQYLGRVKELYLNSGGEILMYFDTPMPSTAPTSVGISGVSNHSATIYRLSDSPDYAKAMYASLLATQARGGRVLVQMWGTYAGYMKLDRIWVQE